ncbi:uncharacterized protein [Eucyclogobius newberryi]|uniref:uncharacterized protein n=1 Tax=Eucyclogobius newberryi TaxID=166745 RepID=UPI003B5C2A24
MIPTLTFLLQLCLVFAAGGTLPAAGGTLPAAGGTLPAAGGTLPAAGGTLPAVGGTLPAVEVSPGQNVTVPCESVLKPGVEYRACRWYKESVEPRLTGLVSMAMPAGTMRWYVGADTGISLEEDTLSLKLPTVNCSDQGVYLCYLAAPVGEQNREGRVRLRVTGCPREVEKVPECPVVPVVLEGPVVPEDPPNPSQLLVLAAALVLILAFGSALTLFSLKRNRWNQPKASVDRPLYPDLARPREKQSLFTNLVLSPNSKICTNFV